jgi:hypothetical protein
MSSTACFETKKYVAVFLNKEFWEELLVYEVNCCWPSVAEQILVSSPFRSHDHIFFLSRLYRVLKWGLLFGERRV